MIIKKVFEDENVLVLDKPAGLVVNSSETVKGETLQDQLSSYFKLKDLGIGDRAGIVHRLDRETSGLLAVAKKQKVFNFLQKQFEARDIKKEYIALVHSRLKTGKGVITGDIGRIGKFGKFGIVMEGRESATEYEVTKNYSFKEDKFGKCLESLSLSINRVNYLKNHALNYSLLKLRPLTGRTHQIRVHLKSIGSPVVSDNLYSPSKLLKFDLAWCPRLFLHASYLEFRISRTKSSLKFNLDLPKDLKSAILNLS